MSRGENDARRAPAPAEEEVTRPDGRVLRELVVYLPADLARKLSLACMDRDRDVSNVMTEVVAAYLDRASGAPAAAPAPSALQRAQELVATLLARIPRFV